MARSEFDLDIYFAGLIDGEGYVAIHRGVLSRRKEREYRYDKPTIAVSMCDEEVIRALKSHFGSGCVDGPRRHKLSTRDIWTWRVICRPAAEVARRLLPYARVKHKALQAVVDHYGQE